MTTLPKVFASGEVTYRHALKADVFLLSIAAPEIAALAKPGQFANVRPEKSTFFLARPLGIAGLSEGKISFIYRLLGKGTGELAELPLGAKVNVLAPLGTGFTEEFRRPLLVGGGMGLSPLLFYAKQNKAAHVLMGGKDKGELFWQDFFEPLAEKIFLATDDGSLGEKGFVTDIMGSIIEQGDYDGVIVCGPTVMMEKAAKIAKEHKLPCQVSLENRMACGLGACLGCAVDTKNGRKKVCKDGPVFWAEEVYDL